MCYFLYLVTVDEIAVNIISDFQNNHDIHFNKVNEYLKEKASKNYYLIHRQCSCDFIRNVDNNYNEISSILIQLKKPFEVILLDKTKQPHIEIDDVISNVLATEKISLEDFLLIYPTKFISSKKYIVS
ncbi:hypothetical protein B1748_17910 [Paenibacillus sp. MY03]|uniref:hypothetical protein n=1 Tax=Paenibacillus sp. MY03 TaxID=302980 RepID=UPI000B3CFFC4|nr:hypothetical protein [Paenibacillus sp. MY03]OUS75354.1 hypothetical protein B1748_17910 [Paenibacillus sp. MY03]